MLELIVVHVLIKAYLAVQFSAAFNLPDGSFKSLQFETCITCEEQH